MISALLPNVTASQADRLTEILTDRRLTVERVQAVLSGVPAGDDRIEEGIGRLEAFLATLPAVSDTAATDSALDYQI